MVTSLNHVRMNRIMERETTEFIDKHNLLPINATVLVGVSGGPDSLALLHFLHREQVHRSLNLVALHVDHMFRGAESKNDLEYVQAYCRDAGIAFEGVSIDVTTYQKKHKVSAQVAARECRYAFFEEMMNKYRAEVLALAHHGDDQVETILMRLARGSTMRGYGGMEAKRPYATGSLVRPFLSVTKEQILLYCRRFNLNPRIDPTNEKDTYTRNRIRQYILPFLKDEYHDIHEKFQAFSENLYEDQAYLEELTTREMNKVIKQQRQGYLLMSRGSFLNISKPLQRRGIQLILNYLYKKIPSDLSSVHINNLLRFLEADKPSGVLHFPNKLTISRSYDDCVFTFELTQSIPAYEYDIPIPGVIQLPNGHSLTARIYNGKYDKKETDIFLVDESKVRFPIRVRTRRPGDKIQLKGMKGHKKVKDIFIDEKVPLEKRDAWPVVEDSNGTILWLPKLKKSAYELHTHKLRYVILYYK